ncbi:MAG: NADH-quinone oxidoreductase subunit J [Thermoflexales bacterium]|nr:NADH-quinone oxidoreductase subunit J [Thermoflexales bacterium]MDW8352826.1 NADH-quinone oxidoreductase subunit J [Anaerolineae bacterium]
MTIQQAIFILLALVILGSAIFVVTTRNLFRAALMMMLTFFGVAGLFVLLEIGLFAVAQVLIYIGAISILIIFAVMLTRGMQGMVPRNSQATAAAVVAGIIFFVLLLLFGPLRTTVDVARWPVISLIAGNASPRDVGGIQWTPAGQPIPPVPETYIADFGRALVDLNQYLLPFLLIAFLVDVVLAGAIFVARQRRPAEVIEDRQRQAEEAAEEAEAMRQAGMKPDAAALPEGAVASTADH